MYYVLQLGTKFKIDGESELENHKGHIDIKSVEWRLMMPMVTDKSSNSRTSGRCKHDDVTCITYPNAGYPKLVDACAKGINLGGAELSFVKMNEGKISEVAKYSLTDVYVSEVQLVSDPSQQKEIDGTAGENSTRPLVRFKLNYQSIAITYNKYDSTGANKGAVSCDAVTGLGGA